MRKPFVLRVQTDDSALARSIARALIEPLHERGARVILHSDSDGEVGSRIAARGFGRIEGAAQGGGSDCAVHIVTAARGMPGASVVTAASRASEDQDARRLLTARVVIGVWDEHDGARWLAPLDVAADPAAAAQETMAFLETWGFIGAPRVAAEQRN